MIIPTVDVTADQCSRALSPVIGTVLLLAIAVALASIAAFGVFGATDRAEPAPDVILELEPTDRPVAHDLVLTNGDPLYGEKVEFRGTADRTPLDGELQSGERLTVYPLEETVRVVWFGEYGTSHVLTRFEPDPMLPPADENCNWVESQTGGATSSVTVDLVVDCNVLTDGDVDLVDPGVVIGEVDSYQNSVDIDHGTVYGTVTANGPVDLDSATVAADVTAGGDVTVTDESRVDGSIATGSSGSIDIDGGSTVQGSLSAGDDLSLASATVDGDVVGPDVDIADSSIRGSVQATSGVSLDGASVSGHVYAPSGSFSCSDSTINGNDCSSYTPRDPSEYDSP